MQGKTRDSRKRRDYLSAHLALRPPYLLCLLYVASRKKFTHQGLAGVVSFPVTSVMVPLRGTKEEKDSE